jgi:single-strand DNA-binding protein
MLNKFICIGRWSKDIELKYTPAGKAVANSTIAINDSYGDKENTTFLPVVMWGKTAENVAQYSKKGNLVAIEGRIQVRSWDGDNGKRYATEVVAENVRFLGSKNETNEQHGNQNKDETPAWDDSNLPF